MSPNLLLYISPISFRDSHVTRQRLCKHAITTATLALVRRRRVSAINGWRVRAMVLKRQRLFRDAVRDNNRTARLTR